MVPFGWVSAQQNSAGVSAQERELMEEACVTLREAERRAIVNAETGLGERFRESAGSVNLQKRIIDESNEMKNKYHAIWKF